MEFSFLWVTVFLPILDKRRYCTTNTSSTIPIKSIWNISYGWISNTNINEQFLLSLFFFLIYLLARREFNTDVTVKENLPILFFFFFFFFIQLVSASKHSFGAIKHRFTFSLRSRSHISAQYVLAFRTVWKNRASSRGITRRDAMSQKIIIGWRESTNETRDNPW